MPRKRTTAQFIEEALEIHANKYDYTLVDYYNAESKVIIICKTHGQFEQRPSSHLIGRGCFKCSKTYAPTSSEFIKQSKQVHGDKYDYSLIVYQGSKTKVSIICKVHGQFEQPPTSHLSGRGCPKCGGKSKLTTTEFIEKAISIHGDKYNYTLVDYYNAESKVTIICNIHGEFKQCPDSHVRGKGCPKCGGKSKLTTAEFIEKAISIHGDKYDYSLVNYKNTTTKLVIVCKTHGKWLQTPNGHLQGYGCQKCGCRGFSKGQIQWLSFLEAYHNISIRHIGNSTQEYLIKSTKWRADGYCADNNTIYEYHGDYWHGNPKRYDPNLMNTACKRTMKTLYDRTIKREQKIKDLGYNLIVIWESDWNRYNRAIGLLQRRIRERFIGSQLEQLNIDDLEEKDATIHT